MNATAAKSLCVFSLLIGCVSACGSGGASTGDGRDADGTTAQPDVAVTDTSTPGDPCSDSNYTACQYDRPTYATDTIDGELSEPSYGRRLAIRVRFPTDAPGPRPVVVVSHGGTLNNKGHELMETWGETLASAGYVAVHVAHATFAEEGLPQLCDAFDIPEGECVVSEEMFNPPVVLKPADASLVFDELPKLGSLLSSQKGVEIDASKVACLGWSGGSQIPTSVAGAVRNASPSVPVSSFDARMLAGVVLSPQGPGFSGYFEDASGTSMDSVQRPLLVATGDNDYKESNELLFPSIRRKTFDNLPAGGDHHLLYSLLPIGVGGHGTYQLSDLSSSDEGLVRLSLALQSAVLAHLDAHLTDSQSAAEYLASDKPKILSGADQTEWSRK